MNTGFREPWFRPDPVFARRLTKEARREIKAGHELDGLALECIARCSGCDHTVFRCADDTFAVVHLTWNSDEHPPWPSTTRLPSFIALEIAMDQHEH
jgi:hypothetical protein